MNGNPISVLLVEDNPGDAGLFRAMLSEETGKFEIHHVDRLARGMECIEKGNFDVVLLDLSLPDSHGPQTFMRVREKFPFMPVVLLTGLNDQLLGLQAIREGVEDYLVKGSVDTHTLARAIRYAIERKRTEMLLLETQKALTSSSKMAALGTMAGGVAHEINSPLACISLWVSHTKEKLEKGDIEKEQIRRVLNDVEQTVNRIAKITRGLKTFARDAQTDPMVYTKVSALIEDTLSMCEFHLRNHDIQLTCDIPKDLGFDCRSTQILQVLFNLLSNACEAVLSLPEKWIQIHAKKINESVEISVTDSGPGISAQIADKIFDPFFTTKDVGSGTGLGLSITKGLVSGHGGEIFLDENSSHTRFVMRLPLYAHGIHKTTDHGTNSLST